jgi:hypothetical protein
MSDRTRFGLSLLGAAFVLGVLGNENRTSRAG